MPQKASADKKRESDEFASQAARPARSFLGEYWDFLRYERKWWLAPLLAFLFLAGGLIALGGTGFAPFLYALF